MSTASVPHTFGYQPSHRSWPTGFAKARSEIMNCTLGVVMPNHAHLLITPHVDVPILLRRLKGASAREANKLLGQTGQPFWQDESYDHLVRDANEFHRIENYILQNPVRAGLAQSAEEYPWCNGWAG